VKNRKPRTRNSETTRELIVQRTARLLKTGGYLRAPMSAIMKVTGMTKGGIYHHFASREDLALEAFQYSTKTLGARMMQAIAGESSARAKLIVLINFPFTDEYWRGGCPIGNLAVESDDESPRLSAAARKTMDWLIGLFTRVIEEGMKASEFARSDARARATQMVAELEGAILLSNLYKDDRFLRGVVDRLESEARAGLPARPK
jgi:TetR/AcrR family transcriptional regulator, transcriptional repressor for nem operon